MTPEEFKVLLLSTDLEEVVDSIVLQGESQYFVGDQVVLVSQAISRRFSVAPDGLDIRVVGSAKLGLALMEKHGPDNMILPRLRPFRPESDIDLAIVSPKLFEVIWDELSIYANTAAVRMPWDSGKLGDYMVHGWLRPDHFPKGVRLRRCDDWWDLFRNLSTDRRLGYRRIRGALFHSFQHLRRYQLRGLADCRSALEIQS